MALRDTSMPEPSGPVGHAPAPAPAPPLDAGDRARLLAGAHHDPHALLGAHPVAGGIAFRALRPFARSVSVVIDGERSPLTSEGDGLFSGLLPLDAIPDYTLRVAYADGEQEVHDPYRFLPALGETDLHLIREGRHEQLWKALGAEPMTHQGVTGTRFTVWAPNAQGVRVAGEFTYWDGQAFPMRSLGASGVWELFLPGIGEGTRYKFEITSRHGDRFLKSDPMARGTEVPPDPASVVTSASAAVSWGWVMGISRSARAPRRCGSSVARDGPIGDCQGRWVALAAGRAPPVRGESASTIWANHRADRAPSCPAHSTGTRAKARKPITRLGA